MTWSKGGGILNSWGLAISHIDANQRAYGPQHSEIPGSPVQYFINPVGIQSVIMSAVELGPSTVLTTDSLQAFSVNANLSPQSASASRISFPLVQGMGFVTATYQSLMPAIQSAVFFRNFVQVSSPRAGVYKYQVSLEDGKSWLLYVIPGNGQDPRLQLVTNTQIQGLRGWSGIIQLSKNSAGANGESVYDASAGVFPLSGAVTASTLGPSGTYQLSWRKGGMTNGQPLLMYALPHHIESLDPAMTSQRTSLQLQTTTKGLATAVLADQWTLVERTLPTDISFAPW